MGVAIIVVVVLLAIVALVVGFVIVRGREEPGVVAPPKAPRRTLADRLQKTRQATAARLAAILQREEFDDDFWAGLEETLIAADVGVATATDVVAAVRADKPADADTARAALRQELLASFAGRDRALALSGRPAVVVVVGVNGTGKTTSIAKLAARLQAQGTEPLLAAADTYRAAADEQLRTWAGRVGVEVVAGSQGADPASVAFTALEKAEAAELGVVIVDTAGRLHSNRNLMDELRKVVRVLEREAGAIDEVLLVMDATTGQNGLAQATTFLDAVGVTGIVLTKMDGTARGGVVAAVERETGIPVKFIGVGEAIDDLVPFDPAAFVEAIIG